MPTCAGDADQGIWRAVTPLQLVIGKEKLQGRRGFGGRMKAPPV